MSDRTYTEQEARELAVQAAHEALKRFSAEHPIPPLLTAAQTAEVLQLSTRTIARMNFRREGGKIPYSEVLKVLASR